MSSIPIVESAPVPAVVTTAAALRSWSHRLRSVGGSVALVPTMGALHHGHRSLFHRARSDCDAVAVSIFVNPTQFAPGEDFGHYPRSLDADLAVCAEDGVDVVFLPDATEMYPEGFGTVVTAAAGLRDSLEGAARPGHFDGVATVVVKLVATARPNRVYFGRKDAQQSAVVRRVLADLDMGTDVVICPVFRDPDGLAASSRNVYLSPDERRRALALPAGLAAAGKRWSQGEATDGELIDVVTNRLAGSNLVPDYVAVVDADAFRPQPQPEAGHLLVAAARVGTTRLLDVVVLGGSPGNPDLA